MLILGVLNISILEDNSEINDMKFTFVCWGKNCFLTIQQVTSDSKAYLDLVLVKQSNRYEMEIEAGVVGICESDHYLTATGLLVEALPVPSD